MRLTTASSVSCTASIASLAFVSEASAEVFRLETPSESAAGKTGDGFLFFLVGRVAGNFARRPIAKRTTRIVEALLDRLQAGLDARDPGRSVLRIVEHAGDALDLRLKIGKRRRRLLRNPIEPLGDGAHELAEIGLVGRR